MTLRTLIRRSLRFHWRSHLGVVIGAAIASAALTGALVVGDSVKGSLRAKALLRLGNTDAVLLPVDRQVSEDLAERMFRIAPLDSGAAYAPLMILSASAVNLEAGARANAIQLIGVDGRFASFGGDYWKRTIETGTAYLNEALAAQLGVEPGQTVIARITKPSVLSQESPSSPRDAAIATLRLGVVAIVPDAALGSLAFTASGRPAFNLFMNLEQLQRATESVGRVNRILARTGAVDNWVAIPGPVADVMYAVGADNSLVHARNADDGSVPLLTGGTSPDPDPVVTHSTRLHKAWRLADAQSAVIHTASGQVEIRSERIFLDPPIERAALTADTNAQPILTYVVNLITSGTNATPYSMVTAAGAPWTPPDLKDDEIVLNQWLAEDLNVEPGNTVSLAYYDPESGGNLAERTNTFRVHSIVPMEMPWADRTLMPDFPGIEKAESTRDWDTAFPLVHEVRPKDDEYWKQNRGTPKAFVTLAAGKQMWANRFGAVTAIRFPVPDSLSEPASSGRESAPASEAASESRLTSAATDLEYRRALEQKILSNLDPAELGLRFEPVREQALKSAEQSQDFGGLFIGFSLFVIASALILMALLFQFGLEQRASEIGTLLALGFTPLRVRRLFLGEGVALAFIGSAIGVAGGVFYAQAMLLGLTTVWRDAIGTSSLQFFATPGSLGIGLAASTFVAAITLWLALRKQARQPAIRLLNADSGLRIERDNTPERRRQGFRMVAKPPTIGGASLALALGLVVWALAAGHTTNAGVFFGAGSFVLIGGLTLLAWRLERSAAAPVGGREGDHPHRKQGHHVSARATSLSIASLAFRGLARRRSRSVATAALLASGTFLVVSIGVFRLDATRDAGNPKSGTGGFALIGEATLPVVQDLNSESGRDFFALNRRDLQGVNVVQFRVREGDDASCLNLNRAQKPRLLGVNPEALEGRFTFAKGEAWQSLESAIRNPQSAIDEVPAIGDANSIQWAMGKRVGDTLDYVDDRGNPFKVRIVGAVANSILQGNLIIDETEFVRRFPNESGYQYFLLDAPAARTAELSAKLTRAMEDYGVQFTPAEARLNQFNAVQNTYLGTFQMLGGLGLLLGSAGLGIVVLRNLLERRGELAVLLALGFVKAQVHRLVLLEHVALLGAGLALGLMAAAVAVLPSLLSPGAQLPYATLTPTLAAVLLNGLIWTWLATRTALRGDLLKALRNE